MADSTVDDLTTDHGVQVTAKWDWTTRADNGRWSNPQQGIRPPRIFTQSNSNLSDQDDGQSIWFSKLKVRGQGRALVIRYESEDGKDFNILGWSIPFTGDTKV